MIRELTITNLALIEELHLSFADGLTVLTGETGAGKSIILQALNLLAGGRATPAMVRSGAESAAIEALFEISPLKDLLLDRIAEMGFETDGTLIIKRVLTSQGRNRYYINGSLATARSAAEISQNLLTIAGQRDQLQLLNPSRHLDFIDTVGDLWSERREFTDLFTRWTGLKNQQQELLQHEREKEQRRDFLAFQCNEIKQAAISTGEDEALVTEKQRLKSADILTRLGTESYELLMETVTESLGRIRKNLEQMATLDDSTAALAQEVSEQYYQLEDHAMRLRDYCHSIPNDPDRLEMIEARLDLLQRLKRKYGGINATLAEVLAYGEKAAQELEELDDLDQRLHMLKKELDGLEQQLLARAAALSGLRQENAGRLQQDMERELLSLRFEQAEFTVHFEPCGQGLEDLDETGWDRPEFMLSANPGVPVKPLANIVSGGELSRVMLAFKCLLARKDMVETVLFDEVDAGIGGKAAEAVARKIKELAAHHQVLCITHLPQIASYADEHFIVTKTIAGQRTRTAISRLAPDERAKELARMLAGDTVTAKTLTYAEELIARRDKGRE